MAALVFVAVHGLSPAAASRGCSLAAVCSPLIAAASLVEEHGLRVRSLQWHRGSAAVAHGLWGIGLSSCSAQVLLPSSMSGLH